MDFAPSSLMNLPRLSKSLSSTNNETSSNSTTDSNHSNMARLQSTVQVLVVLMDDNTVAVSSKGLPMSDNTALGLFVAILGVRAMWADALGGRRASLASIEDGHGR
jgi:hypothetical protein